MSSMNSMRLRELIRSVRQCKTASEERAFVNRECASIREAFKESTPYLRTRNMLKLLYIHMLGYPTEFGQLEVINLLAQSDFSGKRLGYLALQLLVDENDEVLTLAENHMKADMNSSYILLKAVSLNAAANIASEDMARDVLEDVMRILGGATPYLCRKACLAGLRIVRKAPEYAEYFLDACKTNFPPKDSDSLLPMLALINGSLRTDAGASFVGQYRKLATAAVRELKSLVLASRVTDSDVNGITNPFLQVKLLEFMSIIGADSAVTSEALNDVLAQVITNTDATNNAGCAVLYECIRTIELIESDDDLCVLAVNTISRFLVSVRDNNLRVVALKTLEKLTARSQDSVVQHQMTILDCMKDADPSVRIRALDLTVLLVDESNVRLLVPDLLTYLTVCREDMKQHVVANLCKVIEQHSPSDEWRVDTSLRMLKLAKSHAPLSFATELIAIISHQNDDVKTAAARIVWEEASYPFDALHQARKAFLLVALWVLGEYPHLLFAARKIQPTEVAAALADMTTNSTFTIVKQYGLTALMKLATKYSEAADVALATFSNIMTSLDCELQQRACEYATLLRTFPEEATFCFSAMPPIKVTGEDDAVQPVQIVSVSPEVLQQQTATALDDLFDFGGPKPESHIPASAPSSLMEPPRSAFDDLFGSAPTPTPASTAAPATATARAPPSKPSPTTEARAHQDPFAPLASGFSAKTTGAVPAPVATPTPAATMEVFQCTDFSVSLRATRLDTCAAQAEVIVQSRSAEPISALVFQVSVPKTCTVEVAPLSSTSIAPHSALSQHLRIRGDANTELTKVMVRIKVLYNVAGDQREQLFQASHELM